MIATPASIERPEVSSDPLEAHFADLLREATQEQIEVLALKSPAVHFACYTQIEDKNKKLVTPVPNILQLRMSEAYETLRAMGVRVRLICTKPRRAGCSTFAAHILYHHGMRQPCDGVAISDRKDHSESLLNKLTAYAVSDCYPWEAKMTRNPSKAIEWSNGTKWTVDTAENSNAAVGDTNQLGLFSEVSKWPQTTVKSDAKVMAAVLPTLSGTDTVAIAESTPEGAAGWQYETWQTAWTLDEYIANYARGMRPEEQWVKVFAAWFEFADNRREQPCTPEEVEHMQATLDEIEREEIDKYGLDWEQVAWRRQVLKSVCNGDPKVFAYYYPSDDESCWLASGSPRFDMQILAEMERDAERELWECGHLVEQYGGKIGFQRDGDGQILLCEPPRIGLKYLVALDPATDVSQTISADPDRHSLCVWRAGYRDTARDIWKPAKIVARVKPPYYADGDEVAGHVIRLSRYYGHALYCQEVNCGLDILRLCREGGVPTYKRKPLSHRTGTIVEQFGFRLNDQQERNAIIEGFAAAIRERAIEVTCRHVIAECKKFVRKKNGRAEAASGAHDDDVLSSAMAWEVLPSASVYRETKAQFVDPPDRKNWRSVNVSKRGW